MRQPNSIKPQPIEHKAIIDSNSYEDTVELDISDSSLTEEQKAYLELVVKKFQVDCKGEDYKRIRKTTHRKKNDAMNDDKKNRLAQTLTSCIVEKDGKKVLVLFKNPLFFVRKSKNEILIIPGTAQTFAKGGLKDAKENKAVWTYNASCEGDKKFKIDQNLDTILLISYLSRVPAVNKESYKVSLHNFPKIAELLYGKERFQLAPYITEQKIYSIEINKGVELVNEVWDKKTNREKKISILLEMAAVLKSFHEKGLIHFDLKLRNFLIDSHGKIRIIDFDGVKQKNSIVEEAVISTPGYRPEFDTQKFTYSQKIDIFAFVIMAMEVIIMDDLFFNFYRQCKNYNSKLTMQEIIASNIDTFEKDLMGAAKSSYSDSRVGWQCTDPLEFFCMKSFIRQGTNFQDNQHEVFDWDLIENFLEGFFKLNSKNSEDQKVNYKIKKLKDLFNKLSRSLAGDEKTLVDSFVIRLVANKVTPALIVSLRKIKALDSLWEDQCFSDCLRLEKEFNKEPKAAEDRKEQYEALLLKANEAQDFAGLLKDLKIKGSIVGASLQKNIDELNIRKNEFESLTKKEGFEFFKENCYQNFNKYLEDLRGKLINYSKYNIALIRIEEAKQYCLSSLKKLDEIFPTTNAGQASAKVDETKKINSLQEKIQAVEKLMANPDEFVSNDSNLDAVENLAKDAKKLFEQQLRIKVFVEQQEKFRGIIRQLTEIDQKIDESIDKNSFFYKRYSAAVKHPLQYFQFQDSAKLGERLLEADQSCWNEFLSEREKLFNTYQTLIKKMYPNVEKVITIFELLKESEALANQILAAVNRLEKEEGIAEYKKEGQSARQQLEDFKRLATEDMGKDFLDDKYSNDLENTIRNFVENLRSSKERIFMLVNSIESKTANETKTSITQTAGTALNQGSVSAEPGNFSHRMFHSTPLNGGQRQDGNGSNHNPQMSSTTVYPAKPGNGGNRPG